MKRIEDIDIYAYGVTLDEFRARLNVGLPEATIILESTAQGTNAFFELLNDAINTPQEQMEQAQLQALGKTFGLPQESINRLRPWNLRGERQSRPAQHQHHRVAKG